MKVTKQIELPTYKEIREKFPLSSEAQESRNAHIKTIKDILLGNDKTKILAIVGPCSADNTHAVHEYFKMLKPTIDKVSDVIEVVGRVYTAKPRTTSTGYQGISQMPNGPDGNIDFVQGLIESRSMMVDIASMGIPIADEMLYPGNNSYFDDVLSYVAIGARCSEDQEHRLTASALEIPVGVKNPTDGNMKTMYNGVKAANLPHEFVYRDTVVESDGNECAHGILRGGMAGPNYHYEDLIKAYKAAEDCGMVNTGVIVDCNHSNSGKDWMLQRKIAKEVLFNKFNSNRLKYFIRGVMIESYIEDGVCGKDEKTFGKSITDPCLGIEKTCKLLEDLAETMRRNKEVLEKDLPTHD